MAGHDFFLTQKYPWASLSAPRCRSQGSGGTRLDPLARTQACGWPGACGSPFSHEKPAGPGQDWKPPLQIHSSLHSPPPTDRALQTTQRNQPGKSPDFWPQELHQHVSLSLRRQLCPQDTQRQPPSPRQVAGTPCLLFAQQGPGAKVKRKHANTLRSSAGYLSHS